jgi:aminoglycoside/choline kinase family phosphotransferase
MQIEDPEIVQLAEDLLKACPKAEQKASLHSLELLTGDISTRRYVRVHLKRSKYRSLMLMLLSGQMGPVGGGPENLSQDDTFVEVQAFLRRNGIAVPEVLFDARSRKALLVEDVGDLALWHIAQERSPVDDDGEYADALGGSKEEYFKQAIDILIRLQGIEYDPHALPFKRSIGFEQYRREISEIDQYILEPKGATVAERDQLGAVFDAVCETLCSHPKTLSHMDYMGHNLMISREGRLTLIDFQDTSAISPVRDIVSLINDRGMDELLGQELHRKLLLYFFRNGCEQNKSSYDQFCERYTDYLFHWDCRVSGRFAKLSNVDGIKRYAQWIPGTLRRLGRTLVRLEKVYPGMDDLITILCTYLPEVQEGFQDTWELPSFSPGEPPGNADF